MFWGGCLSWQAGALLQVGRHMCTSQLTFSKLLFSPKLFSEGDTRKTWMDVAPLSPLSFQRGGAGGGVGLPLGGRFPGAPSLISSPFNNRGFSSIATEDQRSWRTAGAPLPPPPPTQASTRIPPLRPLNMPPSPNPTSFNLSSMSKVASTSLLPPRPPPTHFVSTTDILTGTQRLATRV